MLKSRQYGVDTTAVTPGASRSPASGYPSEAPRILSVHGGEVPLRAYAVLQQGGTGGRSASSNECRMGSRVDTDEATT